MRKVNSFDELKEAIRARETVVEVTNKDLLKKIKVAQKVKKFAPAIIAATGLSTAALIAGPVGIIGSSLVAAPVMAVAALSTGTTIALIVAAVTVIALFLEYNVEIKANPDGTIEIHYKNK